MRLTAILFDLDDTLLVDETVSHKALSEVSQTACAHYGAEPDRFVRDAARIARQLWEAGPSHAYCRAIGISAFECLWGNFAGETADLTTLREWAKEYRGKVFDAALREQMLEGDEAGVNMAHQFEKARRRLQRLMPDARETIARLRKNYKLALLTNGAPDLQREKIAASGLGLSFEAIAVSGERGIGKPKPEIFHQLLDELKVLPSQAAMVGNSLERDIAGAKTAGLAAAIWLRVPGSEELADVTPDYTINGLHELCPLIARIQEKTPQHVSG